MTIQTSAPANDILNAVAAEVGITPVVDPFASNDSNFVQMQQLLNSTIRQLTRAYDWEFLVKEYSFSTTKGEDGVYDLPSDFLRMIDQTGWERTNRNPINSLSPQQWQYLKGRNLVSETIYVNFRVQQNKFTIYPTPVTSSFEIAYEYISNNAVLSSATGTYVAKVATGADVPIFDSYLLERGLKVKWYESKGFDTTAAQADYNQAYEQLTSSDKAAPVLNAGGTGYGNSRLLNGNSVSDTNYGIA